MRVIVAGSRIITNWEHVHHAILKSDFKFDELVSGGARGVDTLAEGLAELNGVPVKQFLVSPQQWKTLGKKAGPMRNRKMAEYADALVAVWDGVSDGTRNMISEMKKLGKPVFVYLVPKADLEEHSDES